MRKIILFVLLLFLTASAATADMWAIRGYVDILGEYNIVFKARDIMAVPADGARTGIEYGPTLAFNGIFMFGANDNIFAVYLKKDHVEARNKATEALSAVYSATVDEQWGLEYVGAGARKYFFIDRFDTNQILPYLGIDMGAFFASYTESQIIVTDGVNTYSGEMDGQGGLFGMNAEAGADYWFTNELAATLKCGYRVCNGTIKSVKASGNLHDGAGMSDEYNCKIDYSGLYVQLGIIFNFQRYD